MKKGIIAVLTTVTTLFLIGGGAILESRASEPLNIMSQGRIESQNAIFDYRDFEALDNAFQIGKKASYDEGYGTGYQEGYAAKVASGNVSVSMVYHHNTTTGGETVTFTSEEVLNGTRDAWFASNPVPTYVSTAQGDYTKEHYTYVPAVSGCGYRFYGSFKGKCPLCGNEIDVPARYNEDGTPGKNACPHWRDGHDAYNRFDGYTYTVPEGKLLQIITNIDG